MPKPFGTLSVESLSVTETLSLPPFVSMPLWPFAVASTFSNTRPELGYLIVPPIAVGIRPTIELLTTVPFLTVSITFGWLTSNAALFTSEPVYVQVWPSRSTVLLMLPEGKLEPVV